MPIPKIIHFKIPNPATPAQQEAIEIARRLHPDWKVMIWQDPVAPEGFRLAKYWKQTRSGAQQADLVRIEAVLNYGGIYLDSDVIMHRPLDELAAAHDFFIASEDGLILTNAAFGAVAGHPALAKIVDDLDRNPPDWSLPPNVTTGPVLFSRILKWRKDIAVLPRATFYPYNWNDKPCDPHPHTFGTHLWEGSWIRGWVKLVRKFGWQGHLKLLRLRRARGIAKECEKWIHSNEVVIRLFLPRKAKAYPVSEKLIRKTVHGPSIMLSGKDLSVTPKIAHQGYYELREELFLKKVLCGGDYFVDVGANVGAFSLLAACMVGPFGRVYAYEPNPLAADMLKHSATMNWMHERLIVSNVAVGERPGHAMLHFNPSRLGDASIADDTHVEARTRTIEYLGNDEAVNTSIVTLDDEFPYDLPITCLRIDAEGHEAYVLRGAQRLLSRQCVDYVIVKAVEEIAGKAWSDLLDALQQVCGYGYSLYTLGINARPIPIELDAVRVGSRVIRTRNLILMNRFVADRHFRRKAQQRTENDARAGAGSA
ncbi:FkbM family methyltransferase [Dyella sp.]|uniref:FkbM family methyltransferase n=1 Tax=Dyella sp. TaxID=1869338 RepID=UPI002B495E51|nr:FkbM family methyltransferase [Dyella sp.]HKT29571.1 FkbM family methyltransferase [Dyella sp.]